MKKILRKIKKIDHNYLIQCNYIKYYRKLTIKSNVIFLEAQQGNTVNGNIYYILRELSRNKEYKKFEIYLAIRDKKMKTYEKFLEEHDIYNIKIIRWYGKEYFKLLATAHYLITDTSFSPKFIKKEGQIILNTWHGIPLKTLGKKIKNEFYDIGNVQRNIIMADYFLTPNEFMMKHIVEDYMLENLAINTKFLLMGYPRNEIFFDRENNEKIRKEFNLQDKEVYIYMPTWRGTVRGLETQIQLTHINYYLLEIDKNLKENQIMYVNLHPFISKKINYSMFKKIRPFPAKYETYQFLSIADCLITDYSSVFFDFSLTRKKIILFAYDEEEYLQDRGMYLNINKLPFVKVSKIEELINEINLTKRYNEENFIYEYCKYENAEAAKKICEKVILEKNKTNNEKKIKSNGKENVLIYTGNLAKNGITASLKNLLNNIDTSKRNYYLTFYSSIIEKNKDILKEFPADVGYIPIKGKMNTTIFEKVLTYFYNKGLISSNTYIKFSKKYFLLDIKRIYPENVFDYVIHFSGYEKRRIMLYSFMQCKKIIYVHSDMEKEIETRGIQRRDLLEYAYKKYDKVVLVSEGLLDSTCKIANIRDHYYECENLIDYKSVLEKSKRNIEFDKDTVLNIQEEEFVKIINDEKNKKIITIGRFSKEKGHDRLINAFYKLWKENKDIFLIIIGGHGNCYQQITSKIEKLECKKNIILIKSLSNPYAVLNKCNYFVLPSFYEGFGIVIAEADILNKPVICTNIDGPRKFIQSNNGTIVDNSEEGIYKGLKLLVENKVKPMNIDYENYNKNAIKQFEKMLKD